MSIDICYRPPISFSATEETAYRLALMTYRLALTANRLVFLCSRRPYAGLQLRRAAASTFVDAGYRARRRHDLYFIRFFLCGAKASLPCGDDPSAGRLAAGGWKSEGAVPDARGDGEYHERHFAPFRRCPA